MGISVRLTGTGARILPDRRQYGPDTTSARGNAGYKASVAQEMHDLPGRLPVERQPGMGGGHHTVVGQPRPVRLGQADGPVRIPALGTEQAAQAVDPMSVDSVFWAFDIFNGDDVEKSRVLIKKKIEEASDVR